MRNPNAPSAQSLGFANLTPADEVSAPCAPQPQPRHPSAPRLTMTSQPWPNAPHDRLQRLKCLQPWRQCAMATAYWLAADAGNIGGTGTTTPGDSEISSTSVTPVTK